jgi:hypothetical protein
MRHECVREVVFAEIPKRLTPLPLHPHLLAEGFRLGAMNDPGVQERWAVQVIGRTGACAPDGGRVISSQTAGERPLFLFLAAPEPERGHSRLRSLPARPTMPISADHIMLELKSRFPATSHDVRKLRRQ